MKRNVDRWMVGVLGIVVALAGMAGCSGKQKESSKAPVAIEPIRFWHAMTGPLGKSLDGIVAEWNAAHPETPVESVSMGQYEALSQKIMAAVAAGGPPDIAQCYEAWTSNLIANESIVPLDAFISGAEGLDEASLSDVYPILRLGATQGGKLWSFPFNKSVRCLYYNADLFREAGLDPAKPPRTWAEYRDAARRLTRDTNRDGTPEVWGLASQITVTMFENLLAQNGGWLLDDTEKKATFQEAAGVEALEYMTDLLVRDGTSLLTSGFEYQNEFLAGHVGMIEGSSVSLSFIEGKYAFALGIAPLPAGKSDTQVLQGTDVVVFKTNPEREAASWRFVKWFTETAQTAKWSAETSYLPVRASAFADPRLVEVLGKHPGMREAFAQIDRARPQPQARGWYAGRRILETEAIEAVLRGKLQPREALVAAAIKVDAELAKEAAAD